ncbi:MAG: hypothetical protein K6A42_07800, partial [Treponema sp.]|nr:hypothetical protein [Treponema sp.]
MKFRLLPSLFIFASLLALPVFADSSKKSEKILELVESAPVKKIKKFIIRNGHLANEKYGEKENSLLIEALEKGR